MAEDIEKTDIPKQLTSIYSLGDASIG